MFATIPLCVVLYLSASCFAQTPSKSSFTAEFSVLGAGQQIDHVMYYTSVEEKKQLQVVRLGNESTALDIKAYTWLIAHKNKTIEYDNIAPFSYCTGTEIPSDQGYVTLWYWLKNASYTGKIKFNGQEVDTWSYEDKDEQLFLQVGVSPSDPNKPLYYYSTEALGVIVFHKYDGTAPPSSVFEIPATCKVVPNSAQNDLHVYHHCRKLPRVFNSKLPKLE